MAKVLLVVDYQNEFVLGAHGFEGADKIEDGIAEKITEYAKHGDYIICTLDKSDSKKELDQKRESEVKANLRGMNPMHMYGKAKEAADRAGVCFIDKLAYGSEKLIGELHRIDSLERKIDRVGITEIEVCGVMTEFCVLSNAIIANAALPDVKITILSTLCASANPERQKDIFNIMKEMHMEVV